MKLGVVALDGTKLKANASKHKAMSRERMQKEMERLEQKVRELLSVAEQADAQEDAQHGKGRRGDTLPEELRRAKSRLARIRAAHAELLAEAGAGRAAGRGEDRAGAGAGGATGDAAHPGGAGPAARRGPTTQDEAPEEDDPPPGLGPGPLPSNRIAVDKNGEVKGSAQRNFTDPDSRILKGSDGFLQGYNGQLAVCGEHPIIGRTGLATRRPTPSTWCR